MSRFDQIKVGMCVSWTRVREKGSSISFSNQWGKVLAIGSYGLAIIRLRNGRTTIVAVGKLRIDSRPNEITEALFEDPTRIPASAWKSANLISPVRTVDPTPKQKGNMHYKNGRNAIPGDTVVALGNPPQSTPFVGLLHSTNSESTTCNGRLALITPNDPYVTLNECLHIDDVRAAQAPDTTKAPTA